MLVLDASVVVPACTQPEGFEPYEGESLTAPPLMWSEARSVLHRAVFHGVIGPDTGRRAHSRLERAPITARAPDGLGETAWAIADELGWAKTYDAEYLALARLLDCPLVTLDGRMRRAAGRLGIALPGGP